MVPRVALLIASIAGAATALDESKVKLWILIIPIAIGNGLRTMAKRDDYAAKIAKRTQLKSWLTGFILFIGVFQLMIATFLGYLVLRLIFYSLRH